MKRVLTKVFTLILVLPIRIYQYIISPLLPAACRHIPTCSEYVAHALKLHGPLKGGKLAANRILRCNQWGTSGVDPVPKFLIKKIKINTYIFTKQRFKTCNVLKHNPRVIVLALVVSVVSFLASCASPENGKTAKPTVLVSIAPYKYFVEQIASDLADIMILIPPGTNHHDYDPSPRQLQALTKAKLLFINGGLPLEQNLVPSLRQNQPELKIINLSEGINLIYDDDDDDANNHNHHGHNYDPHIWLSFNNGLIIAKNVMTALLEMFPEHQERITANYNTLKAKINEAIELNNVEMANLKCRQFVIFHPALSYYARDYNLEQISIEHEGKEPTPSQLKKIIDIARKTGVQVVFIQKEFDASNARLVAESINGKIVQIDPLAEEWLDNLKAIASLINYPNP